MSYSQTYVMWNISGPYIPPKHTYTCVQSTFYPVPGPIDDLSITSCSVRGSNISVELQWSPPSVIIGELHSYDICTGNIPLVPDQEIPNNGSHKCLHLNVCACVVTLNDRPITLFF